MQPMWQALYDAKADVALAGHDHGYERFAPQNPAGAADPIAGIREFVVGTGGESRFALSHEVPNFETGSSDTFGVIELTLQPDRYAWDFLPSSGSAPNGTYTDSGAETCHGAPPASRR